MTHLSNLYWATAIKIHTTLWKILEKCTTRGVWIFKCTYLLCYFKIRFVTEGVNVFILKSQMSLSTWNWHSTCGGCFLNLPQGCVEFNRIAHMNVTSDRRSFYQRIESQNGVVHPWEKIQSTPNVKSYHKVSRSKSTDLDWRYFPPGMGSNSGVFRFSCDQYDHDSLGVYRHCSGKTLYVLMYILIRE